MHSTTFSVWVSLAAALSLSLSACSVPVDGPRVDGGVEQPASSGQVVVEGSMVTSYLNARDLAGDATTLLLGEVVSSTQVTIADLEFTRYEMQVQSHYAGETPTAIPVYQVGEPNGSIELDVPAHLQVGERYLLFLQPTALPEGETGSDGYYIVGPGAWEDKGDSQFELWREPDSTSDLGTIPTALDLAEIPQLLAVDAVGSSR